MLNETGYGYTGRRTLIERKKAPRRLNAYGRTAADLDFSVSLALRAAQTEAAAHTAAEALATSENTAKQALADVGPLWMFISLRLALVSNTLRELVQRHGSLDRSRYRASMVAAQK